MEPPLDTYLGGKLPWYLQTAICSILKPQKAKMKRKPKNALFIGVAMDTALTPPLTIAHAINVADKAHPKATQTQLF